MKNYYTAFVFGIVSMYTPGSWIQTATSFLMATSVLYHGKKHENYPGRFIVSFMDRTIAHSMCIRSAWEALQMIYTVRTIPYLLAYWSCLLYIFMIYYVARLSNCGGTREDWWHGSIHVVSSFGIYMLYRVQQNEGMILSFRGGGPCGRMDMNLDPPSIGV